MKNYKTAHTFRCAAENASSLTTDYKIGKTETLFIFIYLT